MIQNKNETESLHDNEVEVQAPLTKIKNVSVTIMVLMISLGQWNDTKDVAISAYETFISQFTNQVEYNRIDQLRIGFTNEYVIDLLGKPQVIKESKQYSDVNYYFYNSDKYLLTTFIKLDRLAGFSVIAKQADFEPPIPYLHAVLNNKAIASYLPTQGNIETESDNIEYFAETYEFSKDLMFYNFSLGRVNYQVSQYNKTDEIRALNQQLNMGEGFDFSTITLSSSIIANFYSVSELESNASFEALLSQYEMNMLFGHKE